MCFGGEYGGGNGGVDGVGYFEVAGERVAEGGDVPLTQGLVGGAECASAIAIANAIAIAIAIVVVTAAGIYIVMVLFVRMAMVRMAMGMMVTVDASFYIQLSSQVLPIIIDIIVGTILKHEPIIL